MKYKNPESILVIIFCITTKRCLMLLRKDYVDFWQSVTGSLEENETPIQAAIREVKEETSIDIMTHHYQLIDAHYSVEFEIFETFRHRYAPDVTTNKEHWFYLGLPTEIEPLLTEHLDYQWLDIEAAAKLTLSPNNSEAILKVMNFID